MRGPTLEFGLHLNSDRGYYEAATRNGNPSGCFSSTGRTSGTSHRNDVEPCKLVLTRSHFGIRVASEFKPWLLRRFDKTW